VRGAQELANDLHHALELVEAERDEAIRERDEAQAVIDAVRKVRAAFLALVDGYPALRWAVGKLDEVDGL
jgi:hypothetical protein